jgi:hypothetical protein
MKSRITQLAIQEQRLCVSTEEDPIQVFEFDHQTRSLSLVGVVDSIIPTLSARLLDDKLISFDENGTMRLHSIVLGIPVKISIELTLFRRIKHLVRETLFANGRLLLLDRSLVA